MVLTLSTSWSTSSTKHHPIYIGVIGGYGSTTWDGLVPSNNNKNDALSMSTPVEVSEGGSVWGALIGYEFNRYFAIEANYLKYAHADVIFGDLSLFTFENNGITHFNTKTETVSLIGKIMMDIPSTQFKAYSGAGVANLHREDMLIDEWRVTPIFEMGFIYPVAEHFMAELTGNYTAGFGESQLNPAETYFPFLYSVTVRLAYRF
jgi:hypothetical protein